MVMQGGRGETRIKLIGADLNHTGMHGPNGHFVKAAKRMHFSPKSVAGRVVSGPVYRPVEHLGKRGHSILRYKSPITMSEHPARGKDRGNHSNGAVVTTMVNQSVITVAISPLHPSGLFRAPC
jgi:hypothetical protein